MLTTHPFDDDKLREECGIFGVSAADGGAALVGRNLLDCHPEPSRSQVGEMLRAGRKNCYTIEKQGVKKMKIGRAHV